MYLLKGESLRIILGYFLSYNQTENLIDSVLKLWKNVWNLTTLYHFSTTPSQVTISSPQDNCSSLLVSLFPLLHLKPILNTFARVKKITSSFLCLKSSSDFPSHSNYKPKSLEWAARASYDWALRVFSSLISCCSSLWPLCSSHIGIVVI